VRLRRLSAALALVGTLIISAGCGGSSSGPDSHAEYQEHVEPVARDITGVLSGFRSLAAASLVFPARPTAAIEARAEAEKLRSTLRAAAADLDDVTPPQAVARDHAELTRATRKLAVDMGPVIAKLKVGSLVSVARLQTLPGVAQVHRALTAIDAKGYQLTSSAR
jgi:hypothetical protein